MGRYIAGIFSVPKYQSEDIDDLPFCANDCIALKEVFNKHLGISDESINILGNDVNQEVKKTEILRQVRHISGIALPDDTIIFYFSGHGFSENNFGYLAIRHRLSPPLLSKSLPVHMWIKPLILVKFHNSLKSPLNTAITKNSSKLITGIFSENRTPS